MPLWDSIKAKLAWMAVGAVVSILIVAAWWSWRRQREASADDEARRAEDAAAVSTGEIDKQVEAAQEALEAQHAAEMRSIDEATRRDEERLRRDPRALSRLLIEQGRATDGGQ